MESGLGGLIQGQRLKRPRGGMLRHVICTNCGVITAPTSRRTKSCTANPYGGCGIMKYGTPSAQGKAGGKSSGASPLFSKGVAPRWIPESWAAAREDRG